MNWMLWWVSMQTWSVAPCSAKLRKLRLLAVCVSQLPCRSLIDQPSGLSSQLLKGSLSNRSIRLLADISSVSTRIHGYSYVHDTRLLVVRCCRSKGLMNDRAKVVASVLRAFADICSIKAVCQ